MVRHATPASPITGTDYDALHVGDSFPSHKSGRMYLPQGATGVTNGTVTLDRLFAIPMFVGAETSFAALHMATVTAGGPAYFRPCIYGTTDGVPDDRLWDHGSDVDVSGGFEQQFAINLSFEGLIWLACVAHTTSATFTRFGTWVNGWTGSTAGAMYSGGAMGYGYYQDSITGAPPDPWGSTYNHLSATTSCPIMSLRAT